jgi:hypothetical protein
MLIGTEKRYFIALFIYDLNDNAPVFTSVNGFPSFCPDSASSKVLPHYPKLLLLLLEIELILGKLQQ